MKSMLFSFANVRASHQSIRFFDPFLLMLDYLQEFYAALKDLLLEIKELKDCYEGYSFTFSEFFPQYFQMNFLSLCSKIALLLNFY